MVTEKKKSKYKGQKKSDSDGDSAKDNPLIKIDNKIDLFNFKYRFNAVDLVFQHRLYSLMPESKDTSWLINLSDPDTVKNINNTYFIDNPLDLNSL